MQILLWADNNSQMFFFIMLLELNVGRVAQSV
jgi:hypothetical protein